jgi:ferrous iron transport protein A
LEDVLKKLSEIEIGKKIIVQKLNDSDLSLKLLEMGIYEGQELEIIFKAPFGDPIAIQIGNYVLSLRLNEADQIYVN